MNLRPLFDRVVIAPIVKENLSSSGIVLPETSQERPQIGEIVAVGDGENFDGEKVEMKVKVGDKIVFNRYAGVELKMDGKMYIVMRQIDIIGVCND
ncbi:MAG: co-chaperone GroES [Clostridiales bacterium]|nr:co-chaperone GroES [Clostridiales bacterium]